MIDLAILGILRDCDLHGYELKRRIGDLLGTKHAASWGSLYPALAKLELQGAVKAVEISTNTGAPSMPMTGSLGGEAAAFGSIRRVIRGTRGKKVYSLTTVGWRRFLDFLADPQSDDREFRLKVAFSRHLEPDARAELFQRQLGRLATIASDRHRYPAMSPDRYIESLHTLETQLLETEIRWLTTLAGSEIETIDTPSTPLLQEFTS